LIVGNRIDAHRQALEAGAAVLVTGGFDTEPEIIELADRLELPVISTSYDTFTVAAMINRAIYDQLIKKRGRACRGYFDPFGKNGLLIPS
jgi:predicted transcriptional regulator